MATISFTTIDYASYNYMPRKELFYSGGIAPKNIEELLKMALIEKSICIMYTTE